jgi:hypothetical protein
MRGQGHKIFVDELARFAAGGADPRVTAIAERAGAPLRVAVRGRPGVGRRTVARALDLAGAGRGIAATAGPAADADAVVYVTAEVIKPEDADAIASAGGPLVVVLNKAELSRLAGRADDARFAALVGAPIAPMSGLLAVAALDGLDDELWAALRVLAAAPAGCLDGSFAGFLAADLPVPTDVRLRLLETVDLFGTAVGIAAARRGGTRPQARALLRRLSGVDAVLDEISAIGAEARYRRVLRAVAELEALAVGDDDIHAFLSRDDTVVARMAAAVDLAEAAGLDPGGDDRDHEPAAHLPRAVRWRHYSLGRLGPVSDLQRACGADIARGSLRLWSQACGSPPGEPR